MGDTKQVLEYCATERDPVRTAERLESALRRKIGYTTIIGEDQADTNLFVGVVLDGIADYEFLSVSAEGLDLGALPTPESDLRAIAVIYDADHLSAATLEQLRMWTEHSPRAIGLLLVGTLKLARTLAQPELRIFSGLVHTRIVMVRTPFAQKEATAPRSTRSKLALTAAATVGIGLALVIEAVSPQPVFVTVSDAAVTTVTWLQNQYSKVVASVGD